MDNASIVYLSVAGFIALASLVLPIGYYAVTKKSAFSNNDDFESWFTWAFVISVFWPLVLGVSLAAAATFGFCWCFHRLFSPLMGMKPSNERKE